MASLKAGKSFSAGLGKIQEKVEAVDGLKGSIENLTGISMPDAPDIDLDGSGTIDFEEFVEMMTGKMGDRDSPEEIRRVFKLFDDDETGTTSSRTEP